nr:MULTISPECIES: cyclic-phosphate processing receiver domain-containing protein [unclassified Paenibacillus]
MDVYLDDARPCPPGFVLARNVEECLLLLRDYDIGILSLDYDLGWHEPTGMDVVRGIIASGQYPEQIYLHTSSDIGRRQMYEALYQSKPAHVSLTAGPVPYELLVEIARTQGKPPIK